MLKSALRSPVTTVALFVAAALLVIGGTVGGAQAALNIQSHDYVAQARLTEIHVALIENGEVRENADADTSTAYKHTHSTPGYEHTLLSSIAAQTGGEFAVGHVYDNVLAVRNVAVAPDAGTGIDQFVRVTVYKYWVDANGDKCPALDPSLIVLDLGQAGAGWTIDEGSSTPEKTVLYYEPALAPQGGAHDGIVSESTPFATTFMVDESVLTATGSDGQLSYAKKKPEVKVVVDAVQTHNADAAKTSAWGKVG